MNLLFDNGNKKQIKIIIKIVHQIKFLFFINCTKNLYGIYKKQPKKYKKVHKKICWQNYFFVILYKVTLTLLTVMWINDIIKTQQQKSCGLYISAIGGKN